MTRIKRDFKWFYVCIPCADTKSTTGSRRAPHELCVKPHSPHGRFHQKVETFIFFRKIRFFAKKNVRKKASSNQFYWQNIWKYEKFEGCWWKSLWKSWIFISKSRVTPSQNAKSFRWMSKTSFQGIRSNSFSKLWNSLVPPAFYSPGHGWISPLKKLVREESLRNALPVKRPSLLLEIERFQHFLSSFIGIVKIKIAYLATQYNWRRTIVETGI